MTAPDYSQAAESIWAYANGRWFYDGAAGVPYVRSDLIPAMIEAAVKAERELMATVAAAAFDAMYAFETFSSTIGGEVVTCKGETIFMRKGEVERIMADLRARVLTAIRGAAP